MAYQFRNLIFEGGGVKGIAYVGALEELAKRGIADQIVRVGGTSAGAINAVLVGLNYSLDETRSLLWALNFNRFLDDSWGVVRDSERLVTTFGWYKGDFFRDWIGSIIKAKTGNSESTFADIEALRAQRRFRSLFFMATNLSTHFSEVFSAEHTPRMCVADAVRLSMSIPLFFAAKRSPRGDVYVDGGVLDNYPVKLFDREKYLSSATAGVKTDYYERVNDSVAGRDRPLSSPYTYNKETLGFRLDTKAEISVFRDQAEPTQRSISDFFDYATALIETILDAQASSHLHSDDWQRTVYIDTLGVKTTQFDLGDDLKAQLVESGRAGVQAYFRWFDNNPATNK